MSTSTTIKHTGIAVGTSSRGGFGVGPFDTCFEITCAAQKSSQIDIVGATDLAPKVLDLENVVKVQLLVVSVVGNTVKMLLTSSKGSDQAIPLSSGGKQIFYVPTVGDEFTAIKFVGNGSTVSYLIAGSTS